MLGIGFNPRTHTGCDAEISGRIEALSEFQSTHPHGVRHYELKVTDGDAVFQSTHPHGVRLGEVWFCWLGRHGGFNPRTHTGCDSRSYTQHVFIMVSIHAPTRGATLHGPVLRRGIRVSIHAPTRGATWQCRAFAWLDNIVSIHAPTRGATDVDLPRRMKGGVSIHAPTRGATVCKVTYYKSIN